MRFKEKVCLVTGGGSGIGRAASERFAAEGARVTVIDLNEEHGRDAVRAITEASGEAIFARANVADSAEVRAAIKLALDKWGKLTFSLTTRR